jgi:hypothetical protein
VYFTFIGIIIVLQLFVARSMNVVGSTLGRLAVQLTPFHFIFIHPIDQYINTGNIKS